MKNKFISALSLLSFFTTFPMDNDEACSSEAAETFHVPARAGTVLNTIPKEKLLAAIQQGHIKNERALGLRGVVTSLVRRPVREDREKVPFIEIASSGICGDRQQQSEKVGREFYAVSLMRADVSAVLGGAHVPGDNIHVDGMSLAQQNLEAGDLVVVSAPQGDEIKTILLKTDVPHYGCWEIAARCGPDVLSLLNSEGFFAQGYQEINGLQSRLRGVMLAVVRGGKVFCGDMVRICKKEDPETKAILGTNKLGGLYAKLLENSVSVAAEAEKKEIAIKKARATKIA